jgi:hypothetical protein
MFSYFIGKKENFVDYSLPKDVLYIPLQRTERDCEIPRIE